MTTNKVGDLLRRALFQARAPAETPGDGPPPVGVSRSVTPPLPQAIVRPSAWASGSFYSEATYQSREAMYIFYPHV